MKKKVTFFNIVMFIGFFIISFRLFYLQIIKHDYYLEKLKQMNEKLIYQNNMPRGKIYDRNGILLVDNKLVKTIYFKNDYKLNTKELIDLAYSVKDYLELDYSKLTESYLKEFYLI